MFSGSIPALVTPFKDGRVDEARFRAFVEWQVGQGSHALVPCGTTGESATLSHDEHYQVIDLCIEAASGRVPVIAGCGSNDTATAKAHMRHSAAAGAAAVSRSRTSMRTPSGAGVGTMCTTALITLGGGVKAERWTVMAMRAVARHWARTARRP